MNVKLRFNFFMSIVGALFGIFLVSATALATQTPGIAPISSHPHGKSYPQWAAEWWTWALKTPVQLPSGSHPILDTTSSDCSIGQGGKVWFLAGSFGGKVQRTCSVPTGTALFFPLANNIYLNFASDPTLTNLECTNQANSFKGGFNQIAIVATIDGERVGSPLAYFALSPIFKVQLPTPTSAETNLLAFFGFTETDFPGWLAAENCGFGWWLFTSPLEVGKHTIAFTVTDGISTVQDVNYELTVLSP